MPAGMKHCSAPSLSSRLVTFPYENVFHLVKIFIAVVRPLEDKVGVDGTDFSIK